jgi:RNA recognition motif. (a.k.a. RRM, RBD, or RNP domain)
MFQNFGLVETSRIIRHGRTMVSKGYGFVKFSEPSQVRLSSGLHCTSPVGAVCRSAAQCSDSSVHSCSQQLAVSEHYKYVCNVRSHHLIIQQPTAAKPAHAMLVLAEVQCSMLCNAAAQQAAASAVWHSRHQCSGSRPIYASSGACRTRQHAVGRELSSAL